MAYAMYKAAATIYDACPLCGGTKTKGALACRKCKSDRAASFINCGGCGARIRANYSLCRACYEASRAAVRPLCVDCGKPTKQYAHEYYAQRCWDCEVKRRRGEGPGAREAGQGRGNILKRLLAKFPCQICGYDRMPSEIHRPIPRGKGGMYTAGNMVAVCPRCHTEIERGLTPCPAPMTEEQIRSH